MALDPADLKTETLTNARGWAVVRVTHLPTSLVAAAMRPSITRRDLESRADVIIDTLLAAGANLDVTTGRQAIDEAAQPLEDRGIIVAERGRFRVRDRTVLRYYARMIEHLLASGPGRTH